MPEGENWLMRPWLRGKMNYESLHDGVLDLEDLARMNDALDVADENEKRLQAANAPRS